MQQEPGLGRVFLLSPPMPLILISGIAFNALESPKCGLTLGRAARKVGVFPRFGDFPANRSRNRAAVGYTKGRPMCDLPRNRPAGDPDESK